MLSDYVASSEQGLGDLFGDVLRQLRELKYEVQSSNLTQGVVDFFDTSALRLIPDEQGLQKLLSISDTSDSFELLSLRLRTAIPEIRADYPDPYIQEITLDFPGAQNIEVKLNGNPIDIHRRRDAKVIYIVSGDGIFGVVHTIRGVALMLRSWLLDMAKGLVVLRGICGISQGMSSLSSSSTCGAMCPFLTKAQH